MKKYSVIWEMSGKTTVEAKNKHEAETLVVDASSHIVTADGLNFTLDNFEVFTVID